MKALKIILVAIIAIVAINVSLNNEALANDPPGGCPVSPSSCCDREVQGGQWVDLGCETNSSTTQSCFTEIC